MPPRHGALVRGRSTRARLALRGCRNEPHSAVVNRPLLTNRSPNQPRRPPLAAPLKFGKGHG